MRSIATTFGRPLFADRSRLPLGQRMEAALERVDPAMIGLFFVVVALGIYYFSSPVRDGYNSIAKGIVRASHPLRLRENPSLVIPVRCLNPSPATRSPWASTGRPVGCPWGWSASA